MTGVERIRNAFAAAAAASRTAFIGYFTAGYPTLDDTPLLLKSAADAGVDLIELGVAFSDPVADGATIQNANTVALSGGVTLAKCFEYVREARQKQKVETPIVLMGYSNPLFAYGVTKAVADAAAAGADGFIVVDLPPEEAGELLAACNAHGMSFIPLITPATTDERVELLCSIATSFVYLVSVTGVTGARTAVSDELPAFVQRVRKVCSLPLAVGFGISKPEHVKTIGGLADGAVVGTAIIKAIGDASQGSPASRAQSVRGALDNLLAGCKRKGDGAGPAAKKQKTDDAAQQVAVDGLPKPDRFRFGTFGGRYIPETLVAAHNEIDAAFREAIADPAFVKEVAWYREKFIGGPTVMYKAQRLTEKVGGATIWLKREELAHTGAHKINNALGQALLAKRLNKKRIIAETGAGQHGVATATACALLGMECIVYMGAEDVRRQSLNVFRMKMLGATVHPVKSGSCTLKDAINEAMRDWVTNVHNTHYIIGSAVGAHPFPEMVRYFQSVIGREARAQILEEAGKLPDVVVACVGGGSNAIGMFHEFVPDKGVKLVGVEAGGESGLSGLHSATLTAGAPGVLHGARSFILQDHDGQITKTHSISAGLDYPGVGPEHAFLKDSGRADYTLATDSEALDALQTLAQCEGIIPALEPSHAVAAAIKIAKDMKPDQIVLVNLCGRGDKDMLTVAKALGVTLE